MDLFLVKLKNGEQILCDEYIADYTNTGEDRLESLDGCSYDVLSEEIESITKFCNCYLTSVDPLGTLNFKTNKEIKDFDLTLEVE